MPVGLGLILHEAGAKILKLRNSWIRNKHAK